MTPPRIASLSRSVVNQPARLAVLLLVAAAGCGGDAPVNVIRPADNGMLRLGGEQTPVRTSFCVADQHNFGAVGTGTTATGTPFVITVKSPDRVTVRFGVLRELDEPPPGADRLAGAATTMSLHADGQRITATGNLLHQPDELAATPAVLELAC